VASTTVASTAAGEARRRLGQACASVLGQPPLAPSADRAYSGAAGPYLASGTALESVLGAEPTVSRDESGSAALMTLSYVGEAGSQYYDIRIDRCTSHTLTLH